MAGSRRGRGRRRARSPPDESSAAQEPATRREVAVAERPSKRTSHTFTTSSVNGAWADLLDCLLHQIIPLLSSVHDLLAFSGTCRFWRATFFSFPFAFSSSIPPLLLQPRTRYPCRNRSRSVDSLLYNCEWQIIDPVKKSYSCRRSPPLNPPKGMIYLGCSYGHLIFSNVDQCLLVDVYGGAVVRPPKLKSTNNCEIYYGILVSPLNSPNSCLVLFSRLTVFQWEVGSDSWSQHPLQFNEITQIAFFRGQMFAINFNGLHTIRLLPQLSVHEVAVDWLHRGVEQVDVLYKTTLMNWLVACADMLLLVDLCGNFYVYRLDFSVKPAKWVMVENLGSYSLFISFSLRSPAFSCMNPERWGGKRNCIYVANPPDADEPWTVVELGQKVSGKTWNFGYLHDLAAQPSLHAALPLNRWVLPSFVYRVGQ